MNTKIVAYTVTLIVGVVLGNVAARQIVPTDSIGAKLTALGCKDIGAAPKGHELEGLAKHGYACPSGAFFVTK